MYGNSINFIFFHNYIYNKLDVIIKASRFEKLLVKAPWKCLNFPLEKNISNVSTFSFHTSANYTWFQLWMQDIHLYWSILYCIICLLINRIWILLPPLDCCAAFQHLNETWKETVKKRQLFICALLNFFFWPKKNNFSHTLYFQMHFATAEWEIIRRNKASLFRGGLISSSVVQILLRPSLSQL